jgi:hypothetical protein
MFRNLVRLALILGLVSALSSCGLRERLFGEDVGLPYDASLDTGETRRTFTVEVEALGASLEEARESARHPATRHCIERYGIGDVDWVIDPATGDWAATRTEDGSLIVSGSCVGR